jgi:1-acyl-sn-glycerol-3-phosphate acyltransferase
VSDGPSRALDRERELAQPCCDAERFDRPPTESKPLRTLRRKHDDRPQVSAGPAIPGRSNIFVVAQRLGRALYAGWALGTLTVLMTLAVLLAFVLPWLSWRRASTRFFARTWLGVAGLRVRATGLETLPEGSCVLVANHSSYLDGVVMKAVLPPRFSFVIKREAASLPIVGLLLRRIGAEFIDRHTPGGRQRDARRVVGRAEQGHSLVFFPEGTFDSVVGLKRFHLGAFVAAARGNVPVVPAVLHGVRSALPNGTFVPRPGPLHVEVLPSIGGRGEPPERLRDASRAAIVARLDEPDLAVHASSERAVAPIAPERAH